MNTEHRQQKISFWHSMKTQFIAVVILVAEVIVILYTLMIMPGVWTGDGKCHAGKY